MADRWTDDRDPNWRDPNWRDRSWRDRDRRDPEWRRSEGYGRGGWRGEDEDRPGESSRWAEERTWEADDDREAYERRARAGRGYGEEDQDYGERSRASYGGGRGETYRAGAGPSRPTSQGPRFTTQDYTRGGYADEAGRSDYGYRARQRWEAERQGGEGRYERDYRREDERRTASDRSYGAREEDWRGREPEEDRARGEGGGDFLHRAGERISSWFRGERDEPRGEPRRYSADFGREARWAPDRGHRGRGPKGYRRSDERISEEAHERLTDDPWIDASDVHVEVKNGEVTLSGQVDNREAKHRAERLIEEISGVDHVQNNLRVNPDTLTGAGRGYGSSALEAEMRRNAEATNPGDNGASGLSGRTSTGAAAERSTGEGTDKTGMKR